MIKRLGVPFFTTLIAFVLAMIISELIPTFRDSVFFIAGLITFGVTTILQELLNIKGDK